jgi:hypothetical protein
VGSGLIGYYHYAYQRGGLVLQIKLAMRTKLAEPDAAARPDTPELLRRFHDVLVELLGDDPPIPRLY